MHPAYRKVGQSSRSSKYSIYTCRYIAYIFQESKVIFQGVGGWGPLAMRETYISFDFSGIRDFNGHPGICDVLKR